MKKDTSRPAVTAPAAAASVPAAPTASNAPQPLAASTATAQSNNAPSVHSDNNSGDGGAAANVVASAASPEATRRASTMGRRASTSSTADVFSALELEIMGKENVFNTFLAVHVIQGEMMPKRPDETKLHVSYQVATLVD